MTKTTCFVCGLILVLSAFAGSIPTPDAVFIVDGKKMSVTYPLEFRPGDVLVWVGDLVKLGWISIDEQEKDRLAIRRESTSLVFCNRQNAVSVDNLTIESDTTPEIISGRFFIPLAFTCRALGFNYGVRNALIIESDTSYKAPDTPETGKNSIIGTVLYNGHPVAGIKVRAVTEQRAFVKDAIATTDQHGNYRINGLPDGVFRPFVYVADNPDYFNREGELVLLANNASMEALTIKLGRILTPVFPELGDEITSEGAKLTFSWSECPEAVKYRLAVIDAVTGETVIDVTVTEPSAKVSVKPLVRGRNYRWIVSARGDKGTPLGASPDGGKKLWTFKLKKSDP